MKMVRYLTLGLKLYYIQENLQFLKVKLLIS